MTLLLISFFAGVLTILAPCVLPLLPIILSGSIENPDDKKGPFVIIASLALSMIVFSIFLKATTVFIAVPQSFWAMFSGGLIIGLGIITIFPDLWKNFSSKIGFDSKSNKTFSAATLSNGYKKNIFMGFSLGPVFTSCSPTYALILAIILPASFFVGLLNLIAYAVGLSFVLILIALFGQKIVAKLKIVADPKSKFKKILGALFIIVGLAIFTGFDKQIESTLIEKGYFIDSSSFENSLLENHSEY